MSIKQRELKTYPVVVGKVNYDPEINSRLSTYLTLLDMRCYCYYCTQGIRSNYFGCDGLIAMACLY